MDKNRPTGREKNVTGQGKGVHLRGDGTGKGPVGSGTNLNGRTGQSGGPQGGSQRGSGQRGGGGGKNPLVLIIVLAIALLGGGGGLGNLFGLFGGDDTDYSPSSSSSSYSSTTTSGTNSSSSGSSSYSGNSSTGSTNSNSSGSSSYSGNSSNSSTGSSSGSSSYGGSSTNSSSTGSSYGGNSTDSSAVDQYSAYQNYLDLLFGGSSGFGSAGNDDSFWSDYGDSYYDDQTYGGQSSGSQAASGSQSSGSTQSAGSTSGQGTSQSSSSASSSGSHVSTIGVEGRLNRNVSSKARAKYTKLKGNGKDTVTLMVFMCGTDLESQSGMATRDLQEMTKASISDQVNLLVYTGGCKRWQNQVVSSSVNQIYQVRNGGLKCLNKNAGNGAMTDPDTLSSFITWSKQNFPASRYGLIFWDHGGGSLSGYGYDQKNPRSGSMSLSSISKALKAGGTKFDFIGFDACLMATMENAKMLADYADYMIASEETEPGIGWYYTNWLTALSKNTSLDTLEIGKMITDDFVDTCARQCRGQSATLSVVDLAELSQTMPEDLSAFSQDVLSKIREGEYKTVSSARNGAREFAQSTAIDQIDFIDFALKMGSEEGQALAEVLADAVKYNRTSSNMTRAYGLSVYFPYKKMSSVNTAVATYDALDVDDGFADCIREFASLEIGGQAASGSSGSPLETLLGGLFSMGGSSYGGSSYGGSSYGGSSHGSSSYGGSSYGGSSYGGSSHGSSSYGGASYGGSSAGDIADLLSLLLGGNSSSASGLSGISGVDTSFFGGRSFDMDAATQYLEENQFDPSVLYWQENADGQPVISMSEEQWDLVQGLDLNMFYDNGSGYVDLGLDNIYSFDEEGNLVPDTEGTWISINDQPVAYYHLDTTKTEDSYTITGKVPALLNGERVNLILVYDSDNPKGYIAGAQTDYDSDETDTVARGLLPLEEGDTLEFLCDFYSYDGAFEDSYLLGEPMKVTKNMQLSDTYVGEGQTLILYRFTDIYQQHYWAQALGV